MDGQTSYRRLAGIFAIVSAPLALGATFIVTLAVDFDFELMSDQANLITLGGRAASILRWGEILALFGYYLLLVPVALYLWSWLKPKNTSLVNLLTAFALGFLFIGGVGAAVRMSVLPQMIAAYPEVTDAQQQVMKITFQAITDVVFSGLGLLELLLEGIWWVGIGLLLRTERHSIGFATVILGTLALVSVIGNILAIEPVAMLDALTFILSPLWALWLGIVIIRSPGRNSHPIQASRAT